jgi:hypothetical protein
MDSSAGEWGERYTHLVWENEGEFNFVSGLCIPAPTQHRKGWGATGNRGDKTECGHLLRVGGSLLARSTDHLDALLPEEDPESSNQGTRPRKSPSRLAMAMAGTPNNRTTCICSWVSIKVGRGIQMCWKIRPTKVIFHCSEVSCLSTLPYAYVLARVCTLQV